MEVFWVSGSSFGFLKVFFIFLVVFSFLQFLKCFGFSESFFFVFWNCFGFLEAVWVLWKCFGFPGFSGTVMSGLVMLKAKVTPSKYIIVPRLELMAAICVLQIAETAGQSLALPEERWIF